MCPARRAGCRRASKQEWQDAYATLPQTPFNYETQHYNVGSTEEITIAELAGRVLERTGSASEIVVVPYEEAYEVGFEDMMRRIPEISKVESAIGWKPTRTLNEVLDDVIEFHRVETPIV